MESVMADPTPTPFANAVGKSPGTVEANEQSNESFLVRRPLLFLLIWEADFSRLLGMVLQTPQTPKIGPIGESG